MREKCDEGAREERRARLRVAVRNWLRIGTLVLAVGLGWVLTVGPAQALEIVADDVERAGKVAVGLSAVVGFAYAAYRRLLAPVHEAVLGQLRPNGGSSLTDQMQELRSDLRRVADTVDRVDQRQERMEMRLTDVGDRLARLEGSHRGGNA